MDALGQDPAAGTEALPGDTVTVRVGASGEPVTVPDLIDFDSPLTLAEEDPLRLMGYSPRGNAVIGLNDGIAEKTTALGGKVLKPAADTPMGRFAVLQDPQGVAFQVISYSGG